MQRRIFLMILIAYVALAALYSVVTPIFEAPDEPYHFAMIQYIAREGGLPVQNPAGPKTPWYQEGSQPPLYYALATPILALVPGASDVLYPLPANPHAAIGIGLADINQSAYLHGSADEAFPWQGAPLAVHLVRLFSVLLGLLTVMCVYKIAQLALPELPIAAPLAAAFVAFNPMFLFISGSANNDTLITTLSASAVLILFTLWASERVDRRQLRLIVLLSVILALAALTKLSGLTLYGFAVLILAVLLVKQRISLRWCLTGLLVIGGGLLFIAGWWYVRNYQLYGDLAGTSTMIQIIGPRTTPYTLQAMLNETQGLRISGWALFGWLNVIGPSWFLTVMDWLTVLALVGGVVWIGRLVTLKHWERINTLGLLGALFVIVFASLINWTRQTPGTQARLLFPALPAVAVLTVMGWYGALRFIHPRLAVLPLVPILMVGAAAPFTAIKPAFQPPPSVPQLPADARKLDAHFGQIEVLGAQISHSPIRPGDALPITLYYSGAPDPRNLSLFIAAFDCQRNLIGKIDSYPGGGDLPTSIWQPGVIYADTYNVRIADTLQTPCQPLIEVGWYDFATKTYIPHAGAQPGTQGSITWRAGAILDPAQSAPAPAIAQSAIFSGALQLLGYSLDTNTVQPGGAVHLALNWKGLTPVFEDFTVFVHLDDATGKTITDADSPPRQGDYPTSYWEPGVPLEDEHVLRIPTTILPGQYTLNVGLYRPKDQTRLPVDVGGDTLILSTPIEVK